MKSVRTPVFVGRTQELVQLENALGAAQDGAGRCVAIRGEPGIGKSRLIAEIRRRAGDRGFLALEGRCFEQDSAFAYAPLIDMLRGFFMRCEPPQVLGSLGSYGREIIKLLPELAPHAPDVQPGPALEPQAEKRRLYQALEQLFLSQAEPQPVLIVVEDLHWSDDASLDFLLFLARRISPYPVLLLLSYRRDEPLPGLRGLLAGLDREQIAQEIKLTPFTRGEADLLLRSLLDLDHPLEPEFLDAIYELTEGNPFFLEEVCTSLVASGQIYHAGGRWQPKPMGKLDVPDSIHRIVEHRIQQLSPPARQVVDLAAIGGRSFDFAVLQALTGHTESQLLELIKELTAAQLVVEESADQFAFRHALTREALYARLLARERQTLHGQIAHAIEHIHAGALEAHLETLAYNFYEAAMWTKTLEYAGRAGAKAQRLYAPRAAIEQFTRALEAAGRLSLTPPLDLYRLRGEAFDTLGEFDHARSDYEAALGAARAAGDRQAEWQALLDLGMLWASHDYARSGDYCRQALDVARSTGDLAALGHSLNRLGNWTMNSGGAFEALTYHQQALDLFEALDDRPGIAASLDLLAMTSNQCGDAAGAVAYYQRAIPILRELGDRQTLASSLSTLSAYTLDEAQAREAVELAREIGWRSGEAYALEYLGQLLAQRGDYGQGLCAVQNGYEIAQAIDHRQWMAWADISLGLIYSELLAADEAYRHLARGRAIATEVGSNFMILFATGLLASVCISQGRLDEAAALLSERLAEPDRSPDYFVVAKASVELALARRNARQGLQVLDGLELPVRASWLGVMAYFCGDILQLRGEALMPLGRLEEAEAALQRALDLYQEQDIRMGLWRFHVSLGKLYQAVPDPERATAAFAAARTLIEELAATVTDEGLRENFRRRASATIPSVRSLTARQAAKQEFGGLTRRERQVAAVVAQGLSNHEIAEALVVSVKTVEAHISRILSKLGFSSRAQIAAWAVDKGLAPAPPDLDSRLKAKR